MTEIKYEKPLEEYTVDNFVEESRRLIGQPVRGIAETPAADSARIDFTVSFAGALGNEDPLYTNLSYAVRSRYATLIAPPTFLVAFRYPISHGVLYDGPYPLTGLEAGFNWEWHDVIRMNDRFTTEHILMDVSEKAGDKGRTVHLVSECKYWNQLKELVATCCGTYTAIARAESITEIPDAVTEGFRKQPLTDRKVYQYSEDEVEHIITDINAEEIRGAKPRYWKDVNVGDTLPPVVKLLTLSGLMSYVKMVLSVKDFPGFGLRYRKGFKTPGFLRTNTLMGWPYDVQLNEHLDPHMSGAAGMSHPFALGTLRAGLCTHLLTNWMGDDGFLRRVSVDNLEPYIYGDTMWISGQVVEKYKEKMGETLYRAVDIKIEATNQLGQKVQSGTATVYLPSPGLEVRLPIPS